MKTIINKFLLLVMLFAGSAALHSCSDPDGILDDITYGREFSPLNFTHTLSNNVNVTFSWTVMTGIADYTLTLSYTDGEGGVYDQVDLIAPLDGDGNTVKTMEYSFRELPGNREWIAELVAVSQVRMKGLWLSVCWLRPELHKPDAQDPFPVSSGMRTPGPCA